MHLLVLNEIESLFKIYLVNCTLLLIPSLDLYNASLNFLYSVLLNLSLDFEIHNLLLQSFFAMLGLLLFSHGESHWTLVKNLIRLYGRTDGFFHPVQQKASFRLVERDLANDLIEALTEELFSNWTETWLACLPLKQLLIKHYSQTSHIDPGGRFRAHFLDIVFALFDPLSWWQDRV